MDQKINLEEETILGLVLTDGMLLELLEKREFKTHFQRNAFLIETNSFIKGCG